MTPKHISVNPHRSTSLLWHRLSHPPYPKRLKVYQCTYLEVSFLGDPQQAFRQILAALRYIKNKLIDDKKKQTNKQTK